VSSYIEAIPFEVGFCVRKESNRTIQSATMKYIAAAAALVGSTYAHGHHDNQTPIEGPHQGLWYNQLPGDGGTQVCS